MVDDQETYPKPSHGWTCFHCGETFTTPGAARDHFGFEPSRDPGCRIKLGAERGLLRELRKAENEIDRLTYELHNDGADGIRAHRTQTARHHGQLLASEEAGYERGLRDGLSKAEGPIIQALAKGSFMMTETHPSLKAPRGRKLVMGFANPDDADDALQIISLALLDHRRALGSESRAERSEARSEPAA